MADDRTEYELANPPSDGISAVVFSPQPANFLLVGSWDSTTRLYDVVNNSLRSKFTSQGPVFDVCFAETTRGFSGGLDQVVRSYDFNTNFEASLGLHEAAVRCVQYTDSVNLLVSGSWDKTIKLWDPRSRTLVGTYAQPDKVYTMCVSNEKLVVGMAGRHVWIWDLRNMGAVQQRRESSLKFQTRCIRAFPDGAGYVVSSIEGRVAVEWFDPSPEIQKKKFAFKCHRTTVDGQDTIYPVNAVAMHPRYGTFATGGCDGIVNMWDGRNKKRLCQFHRYPTSISGLSFNHDGSTLAIASSYTYEEGEKDHPADAIYIRACSDGETKPK